jgi:Kef-type K+ transport system membrane component KefB
VQVFVLGTLHFAMSTLAIAGAAIALAGYSGPAALVVGGALALSSTAVVMRIMQDRSETGSRHGRATFAILLFQDLAVVVLLMLVPLLAAGGTGAAHATAFTHCVGYRALRLCVCCTCLPQFSGGGVVLAQHPRRAGGITLIMRALGVAAIKAIVCVTGIIIAGRTLLRPVFRRINAIDNDELFAATTLLVVLGSSVLTQIAGLSQALGAFLAGLLMAETEYALQVRAVYTLTVLCVRPQWRRLHNKPTCVHNHNKPACVHWAEQSVALPSHLPPCAQVESDIKPFKGLLMGLFFMSVGMDMQFAVFFRNWATVLASLVALVVGKLAIMMAIGKPAGLSTLSALRSGLYLAPGGEFAFVVFSEAVEKGLLTANEVAPIVFMVVLSMAITPYLGVRACSPRAFRATLCPHSCLESVCFGIRTAEHCTSKANCDV